MLLDFEVTPCSRQCFVSGRTLLPGESYYSTLHMERCGPIRKDYAAAAWQGPAEGAIAWWRSRTAENESSRPKLAPQDVLLNLFTELAHRPEDAEFRYVLGLLLVRRRIVKLEETRRDDQGEVMMLECPRRNELYELRVAAPDPSRTEELQRRMIELLYGGE